MSIKLRDLIRSVRACKTAAEERAIITKESALIRTAFKDEHAHSASYGDTRERNVAKLLYIHMLGYPTHFGQMECIKLIASAKFSEKRLGYLALALLLDEKVEVLTLVTNSLQMDLNTTASPFVVGLALTALGNIGSAEMARDLAKDVDACLKNGNPHIRKKAALCSIRMLRKCPELIDMFLPHIVTLLTDKNHNVLLTGVELVTAVMEIEPAYTDKFTRLVPALVKILRRLLTSSFTPEYDFGGVCDPFLQARLLRLLRVLGAGNAGASEAMNNVLAHVASNTDSGRGAGAAVLYECVSTIMSVESESGLRVLAVNILGKFLGSKDANLKYVALETLCKVIHLDALAVQRHRAVIVECLRDSDVSIRKRALELVYALVNPDNVRALTKELLNYLSVAEVDIRGDLCIKIAAVADKFAVSPRWHIDTLIQTLAIAGNATKKELSSTTLYLISKEAGAHAALVHKLFAMLSAAASATGEAQQPLIQVAVWCIGEYGAYLTSPPPASGDDVVGPLGDVRSELDVVKALDRTLHLYYTTAETKAMVLTALLKLSVRFSDPHVLARVRKMMGAYDGSGDIELQQRSIEFTQIAEPGRVTLLDAKRGDLLAPMPLLNEAVLRARAGAATGAASDAHALAGEDESMAVVERGTVAKAIPTEAGSSGLDADLFGLMGAGPSAPASHSAAKASARAPGAGGLDLDALFSGVSATADVTPSPAPPAAHAPAPSPSLPSMDDIFGGGALVKPAPAPAVSYDVTVGRGVLASAPAPAPAPPRVDISDLFAPSGPAAAAGHTAVAPAASTSPAGIALPYTFTAYEGKHVRALFKCEKPFGPGAAMTDITATFTSVAGAAMSSFVCQVAVTKFLKLTLLPASGTVLNASTPVTQVIKLENSQQGVKALAVRLRFEYMLVGSSEAVVEQVDIKTFPPSL